MDTRNLPSRLFPNYRHRTSNQQGSYSPSTHETHDEPRNSSSRSLDPDSSSISSLWGLEWPASKHPRNILLVKKRGDDRNRELIAEFAQYLAREYPHVNVVVEREIKDEFTPLLDFAYSPSHEERIKELRRVTDAIVTFGGDGTTLHAVSLFSSNIVPPVLSFSLGSLGFLLPFQFKDYKQAFSDLYNSKSKVLKRQRLRCTKLKSPGDTTSHQSIHAMNEISLTRGRDPHLVSLQIWVDGQFLTEAIADGLIISTPTGSTAYSLSAGGPIVHPSIPTILLTPICPRSLSFRPLLLPLTSKIKIVVDDKSRSDVEIGIDGSKHGFLKQSQSLLIQGGDLDWEVPCLVRNSTVADSDDSDVTQVVLESDGWVKDLNELLGFNFGFGSKSRDKIDGKRSEHRHDFIT